MTLPSSLAISNSSGIDGPLARNRIYYDLRQPLLVPQGHISRHHFAPDIKHPSNKTTTFNNLNINVFLEFR
jgi:hypothetical protein